MLKLALASLAVTSFAIAGCTADTTDPSTAGAEDTDVSADELSTRSARFIGSYAWHAADSGELVDFQALSLDADGTYTAKVDSMLVNATKRPLPEIEGMAPRAGLPSAATLTNCVAPVESSRTNR